MAIDSRTLVSFSDTIRPVILKTGVKKAANVTKGKNSERILSKNGSESNECDLFGTVIIEIVAFSPSVGHD